MVDIEERLIQIKELIDAGKYLSLNKARQYGKTTTLHALCNYLKADYYVVYLDFQLVMSSASYESENTFALSFARAFYRAFSRSYKNSSNESVLNAFEKSYLHSRDIYNLVYLFDDLHDVCQQLNKSVVLILDEVDRAGNYDVFVDFLSMLRGAYLNRHDCTTFQSVILTGVYDMRNIQRKIKKNYDAGDTSPWNIAADVTIDMNFQPKQIAKMLEEYASDTRQIIDCNEIAHILYDYTQGYPFLVSRLCQIIHTSYHWTKQGVISAILQLLKEANPLFMNMVKNINDYSELKQLLKDILFCGKQFTFHLGNKVIQIGTMQGILKEDNGIVMISNRLFEIYLYNLFISEESTTSPTYFEGQKGLSQFIQNGDIDMFCVMQKFAEHFHDEYGDENEKFKEEQCRKLFLLYMRPIINGVGHYYIESRTRTHGRTDIILDYKGKQYIIELKIYRGHQYHQKGLRQLEKYLDDYHQDTGYLLTFDFQQNKQAACHRHLLKNHTIFEVVV